MIATVFAELGDAQHSLSGMWIGARVTARTCILHSTSSPGTCLYFIVFPPNAHFQTCRPRSSPALLSDAHDFAAPSPVVAFYLLLLDQPDAFYAAAAPTAVGGGVAGIWDALARQRLNMPPELVERVRAARGQLRADRSAMRMFCMKQYLDVATCWH